MELRKYKGIDFARMLFACLIPVLHIGFNGPVFFFVKQYVARLGVPFFFAVSGMFLAKSIQKNGRLNALKKYFFRVSRILIVWLIIYLPILILRLEGVTVQEIVFKTPGFLWYLSALLAACIPFCIIKNRKVLLFASLALYFFGTLFGETYSWLTGGLPMYDSIFLTTRNGLFFGLPMMCIGEATWRREKIAIPTLIILLVGLIFEITFVCRHTAPGSMYLFLPGIVFLLVILFRNWNVKANTTLYGGFSTAIYVMQFGIITVVMKACEMGGDIRLLHIFIYMGLGYSYSNNLLLCIS